MRKLNFNEVLIISKIFREMNVKYYLEYLMGTKFNNMIKNDKDKQKIIAADIIAFIIQNIELAQNSCFELIASYKQLKIEDVQYLDFDAIIDIFKEMFTNGLPDVLSKLLNSTSMNDELKKNLESLKKNQ